TITIIDILIIFFKKTSTPGKFIHAFLILQHRQNRTQDYLISHIAACSIKRTSFIGNLKIVEKLVEYGCLTENYVKSWAFS
ncbi:MAG TPA: hypothetical protein PLC51_00835, partial [Candidatus Marinimicrobia bacterium]|nr:hypothetical protein [Candidatus Neomarinimicrobiota bacterium]